jgi:hypothetical protein
LRHRWQRQDDHAAPASEALECEKRVTLAIEKHRTKLATFIAALFYGLSSIRPSCRLPSWARAPL